MANYNPDTSGLKPFRPGESGNPSGRPVGSKNLSTILKEMLDEEIEIIDGGGKKKKKLSEVIIRQLIKKGKDGDMRAVQEIFDRVEGKSKQAIEHSGQVTGITVKVIQPEDQESE